MNAKKWLPNLIYALSFILSLLLVLALFSSLKPDDLKLYFNSDALYLPSLYRDLFIDHNCLKGWHLNPSPGFFPDMITFFFLMYISGNLIISAFLFSLIQYSAIIFLIPVLFRHVFPEVSRLFIAFSVLILTLLLIVTFTSHDFTFTFYILSNAYHTGAFLMGLICFVLTLKYLKKPTITKLILILVLCSLSVLSDRLFIGVYTIPVFTLIFFLWKRRYVKEVYRVLFINVLALILGLGLFRVIDLSHYVFIDQANSFLNIPNIQSSFSLLFKQLVEYLLACNIKSLIIFLSLLSFSGLIFLFFWKEMKKEEHIFLRYYCLFSITFTLVVLFMPVLAGNYTGYDTIRYNISIFYLLIINTGIIGASIFHDRLMNLPVRLTITLIPLAFSLVLTYLIVSQFSGTGLKNFFNYYPNIVRCVDDAAQKDKLLYGVGGYWDAKYITLFSKRGVHIYSVYDDLTPCNHVTNENWFTNPHAVFNFMIQNHVADSLAYRKRLGLIGEQLNSGEAQIIKFPPYKYQPNGYQITWLKEKQ